MLARLKRSLGKPFLRYFDFRFSELGAQVDDVQELLERTGGLDLRRWTALSSVDVSRHNASTPPPDFGTLVSQVVSARQFEHPDFQCFARMLTGSTVPLPWQLHAWPLGQIQRKLWEWCYVLKAAEQNGKLAREVDAVGFGVGTEPVPAALASCGVRVLATDRDPRASEGWAKSNQHMSGIDAVSKPHIVPDEELARLVRTRHVDMNEIPDDLGTFDLIWSSCALEHLGSPEAGLEFVLGTLRNLRPGGIAVHTTELELTPRESTADYGHLAVYRLDDLENLRTRVLEHGFEMPVNWHVALESPADRWISLPPHSDGDRSHLKLLLGDSVSTSVGLMISRPPSRAESSSS